jgi:ubiquinone/menaquinone biosynthesis C-methylase UbiE
MSVEAALLKEKYQRSDQSEYIDGLLARQRLVNARVVGFACRHIPKGGTVVDTCAGPEGSLLPWVVLGEGKWIGNDLSVKFAETLKQSLADNVVLSDFSRSPFRKEIADGVFMIFALNNIDRTEAPLSEANRVLKKDGILVVADPGPSNWLIKILLAGAACEDIQIPLGLKIKEKVHGHFATKAYTLDEYMKFYVVNKLGLSMEEFLKALRDIDTENPSKFEFEATRLVKTRYFENLIVTAQNNGLGLINQGIMAMAKTAEGKDWLVSGVIPVEEDEFLPEYYDILKWRSNTAEQIGDAYKSASVRVVVPVMCFKKD